MLELRQLKLCVGHSDADFQNAILKALGLRAIFKNELPHYSYELNKVSIDARKKPNLFFIYNVIISFSDEQNSKKIENLILKNNAKRRNSEKADIVAYEYVKYVIPQANLDILQKKDYLSPVVIGSGPAGLFCAYILAKAGLRPLVLERGEPVDKRKCTVEKYWTDGKLNTESNVQFGEGGAGTFSDGKLNTLTKDKYGRQTFVLNTFVKYGAHPRIKYDSKPHIGTDVLVDVVKNIRNEIIDLGGSFRFLSKVTDFVVDDSGNISAVKINGSEQIDCKDVIFAIGHSARDTFEMLHNNNVNMQQKSFAMGFRVKHNQEMINVSQYGYDYPEILEAAPYKLANECSNGRRVYSFCMCPGGYVVNSSSENNMICVNGMSYSGRDSGFANSAIIIGVEPDDFYCNDQAVNKDNPLLGMYYQREIENKAYILGKGNVPAQRFGDFENDKVSDDLIHENQGVKGNISSANLRDIFSTDMNEAFIESMHIFGNRIKGFDNSDTMLYGVEARTSSPIRIIRDENFQSNIKGLFPCGEGAGYAGGIMSAAVDGIKVAEAVINNICNKY